MKIGCKKNNVCKVADLKMISPQGSADRFIDMDGSTKIYRYMRFQKLKDILEQNSICLSNAKENTDKHEREIPARFFREWPDGQKENYNNLSQLIQEKVKAYLSCWTTSEDNYALWKIYDWEKNGCMIETTFDKLKAAFPTETVFYKVKYVGRSEEKESFHLQTICLAKEGIPTIRGCEEFKRFPYEYEKEVRAVIYSTCDYKAIEVPISPKDLITGIMFNPLSSEKAQRNVEAIVHKYLPELEIKSSIIDDK